MSETQPSQDLPEEDGHQSRAPHRVIGTPPPAQARTLLGEAPVSPVPEPPRELPAGPDNQAKAKSAEKIVAACFILSMLASIGFIAAYVGLEVHSVDATLRSNLALGLSMGIAFLALATQDCVTDADNVSWLRASRSRGVRSIALTSPNRKNRNMIGRIGACCRVAASARASAAAVTELRSARLRSVGGGSLMRRAR